MPAHIQYQITPIIFYKFVCKNLEINSCYVGHTTNFNHRKNQHKYCCNTEKSPKYNLKIYEAIRQNGGFNNWEIVKIHQQICLDKSDACKIEQKYIEELQANMNTLNATFNRAQWNLIHNEIISKKQQLYRLKNREHLIEQKKQYYLENKEHLTQQNKQYYLENKEQITKYKNQWYLENKERRSEHKKKYELDNKAKFKLVRSQSIDCPCGKKYTHGNRSRHFKSKIHLEHLELINNIDIIQNEFPNSEK